ncbi:hypothetical protein RFI_26895 [Reticulomyxa filosa]|uniref:Uncharacterized protein n=1 Tax=Reticulomyxa filosa TaxID=46433 RepID=X6MBR0_RETFI|nr:hypothetical protein RFI_26895 [Reticulomyxa filosa]|eukprot:ETO10480.1 hypothetical protein RFI_26895 [Reticulomyxa filosa]
MQTTSGKMYQNIVTKEMTTKRPAELGKEADGDRQEEHSPKYEEGSAVDSIPTNTVGESKTSEHNATSTTFANKSIPVKPKIKLVEGVSDESSDEVTIDNKGREQHKPKNAQSKTIKIAPLGISKSGVASKSKNLNGNGTKVSLNDYSDKKDEQSLQRIGQTISSLYLLIAIIFLFFFFFFAPFSL